MAKFGVAPELHPRLLALVGDSADGFPGLPGWGAKSAATVLARWGHLEAIPPDPADWGVTVRGAAKLAMTLQRSPAMTPCCSRSWPRCGSIARSSQVEDLRWRGPTGDFARVCADLDASGLSRRAEALAAAR